MRHTRQGRLKLPSISFATFCVLLFSAETQGETAKLRMPAEDVHEPVYIYAPASNNGVLLTEPDGKTIRYFYRQYAQSGYTPTAIRNERPLAL